MARTNVFCVLASFYTNTVTLGLLHYWQEGHSPLVPYTSNYNDFRMRYQFIGQEPTY